MFPQAMRSFDFKVTGFDVLTPTPNMHYSIGYGISLLLCNLVIAYAFSFIIALTDILLYAVTEINFITEVIPRWVPKK